MQDYPETHQQGRLSVENEDIVLGQARDSCDFGIQIANDGRVWVCINGIAFLRFKPCIDGSNLAVEENTDDPQE